jgi:hypothetical protein
LEKVYIISDGTANYGEMIIDYLKSLGGKNKFGFRGQATGYPYHLDEFGIVDFSLRIPEGFEEKILK